MFMWIVNMKKMTVIDLLPLALNSVVATHQTKSVLNTCTRTYTRPHALRPGLAIDLFHQIKGCWSHYRSSLSLSSMPMPQTDVFGSLPDSPRFINPLSGREREREREDIWVNLHRHLIPSVMMSCIHQAVGTICFCLSVLLLHHLGWWMFWCHFPDTGTFRC